MTTCFLDARRGMHGAVVPPEVDVEVPLFVDRALDDATSSRRCLTSELIPTPTFRRLADQALHCRDRFLHLATGEEGVAPERSLSMFRGDDLLLLWREILYGQALATAIAERRWQRVQWQPGEGGGITGTAEILARSIEGGLDDGIRWQRLRSVSRHRAHFDLRWRQRAGNLYRKVRNRLERHWPPPLQPGRCLAIFSTQQWLRFSSALDDLQSRYGDGLSVWYLGRLEKALVEAMGRRRVPLSHLPMPPIVDPDLEAFFRSRHLHWQSHGRHQLAEEMSCPAIASTALESTFETYFRFTFPRACQWMRELEAHLQRRAPELVVGSAAFTYTSAMPLLAAQHLDIPSLALSHTYIGGDHSPVPARYLACRNAFERQGFARSFCDDARIIHCHNASDTLSYPTDAAPPNSRSDKRRRVALLTASPQFQVQAMPLHQLGPWIDTLHALCAPPDDLCDIEWVFKFHPRFDLTAHLEGVGRAANVTIYPAAASVHDLLADCWLAVLVNHFGGVGVDARLLGVPVVFLDSASYYYPQTAPESLQAQRLEHPEALWQEVRALQNEPSRYEALQHHNERFVAESLGVAESSLLQCLEQGLPEAS